MFSWGQFMKINHVTLTSLGPALRAERKRQELSREDAASVCGVSTSFIRDAESNPENCTLGKLAKLINGLGLSLELVQRARDLADQQQSDRSALGKTASRRPRVSAVWLRQADFGVADAQLVGSVPLMEQHRTEKKPKVQAK